ncbi:MAG TPA: DNA-directed RNA polymerase subunit beta [Bacillales bacterium]|nr:DNA-directed RNA polymerase subunit beta [Bacillales bacterium]
MNERKVAEPKKTNTEAEVDVEKASGEESAETRKERREQKKEKRRGKHKYRIRLIPIWLRLLIVVILLAASLAAGTMVGYGVVGKGDPMDVFDKQTWMHVYNVVYKDAE